MYKLLITGLDYWTGIFLVFTHSKVFWHIFFAFSHSKAVFTTHSKFFKLSLTGQWPVQNFQPATKR